MVYRVNDPEDNIGKNREMVKNSTNSYIDDILIDETVVTTAVVVRHLRNFGLLTKPLELLGGGGSSIGIQVEER